MPRFSSPDELTFALIASYAEHDTPLTLLCQWNRLTVTFRIEKLSRMHKSREGSRWFYVFCVDQNDHEVILKIKLKTTANPVQEIKRVRPSI